MPRHHHVNLGVPTGGIAAQIEFLEDVVGYRRVRLTPEQEAMGVLWFEGIDGRQIHLSEDPEHAPPKRAHVAVTCDDDELAAVIGRLERAGITSRDVGGTGIRTFLVIKDPSGNRWEIRSDDPPYAGAPNGVEAVLADARARLDRVTVDQLDAELAGGALLVDIRPSEQRERDGEIPGATIIDRNVLEWRLAPTSEHRIAEAGDPDLRVIVVCNEGYASSLAAAQLRDVGLHRATDLDGGYQAWLRATAQRVG